MKAGILFFILILGHICCKAQRDPLDNGHINERGFFQYTSNEKRLEFLDYVKEKKWDMNIYFYFDLINKSTGKTIHVVLQTYDIYAMDSIKSFQSLSNGLIVRKIPSSLKKNIVDDKIYKEISKLSDDEFFSRYVTENGLLQNVGNCEIEKAVLLRLLKSNLTLGQGSMSGEWKLGRGGKAE